MFGEEHAVANGVPIVKYGAVRQTGGFGSGGRARSKLNVGDLVRMEILIGERRGGRGGDYVVVRRGGCQGCGIRTAIRIIDYNDLTKRGQDIGLQLSGFEVWDQLPEQGYVRSWRFSREIRLRADD